MKLLLSPSPSLPGADDKNSLSIHLIEYLTFGLWWPIERTRNKNDDFSSLMVMMCFMTVYFFIKQR